MLFYSWVKGGHYLGFSVAANTSRVHCLVFLIYTLETSFKILDLSHFVQEKDTKIPLYTGQLDLGEGQRARRVFV